MYIYMLRDGYWIASFEVIIRTDTPSPKVGFSAAKNVQIFGAGNCCFCRLVFLFGQKNVDKEKHQDEKKLFSDVFLKLCRADSSTLANSNNKRSCSKTIEIISGQNSVVFCLAKILSRRSRFSRSTSNPSRRIRPRPIDCDRGSEYPLNKKFPRF